MVGIAFHALELFHSGKNLINLFSGTYEPMVTKKKQEIKSETGRIMGLINSGRYAMSDVWYVSQLS